jgi:hypothetical protein
VICDQTIVVVRAGDSDRPVPQHGGRLGSAGRTTVVGVSVQPEVQQETSKPGRQAGDDRLPGVSDSGSTST